MSKAAIKAVTTRAAEDEEFYGRVFQENSQIPQGYNPTREEWMRIKTGDVRWIEGWLSEKLDPQIVEKVFMPILSREV